MNVTTLGFRVKSGFAIAVALRGPASAPQAVARWVVELSDPDASETRQPYHDGFYHEQNDARELARRITIVKRCAKKSVAALIDDVLKEREAFSPPLAGIQRASRAGSRATNARPKGSRSKQHARLRAGLVVGSVIDPERVGNPHIRAHANEGQLFRTVLEDALRSHGIDCNIIVEKQLAAQAAAALGRRDGDITRVLAAFGKTLGSPWRADEKAAATAAWLVI
jgi:hypothetical protein